MALDPKTITAARTNLIRLVDDQPGLTGEVSKLVGDLDSGTISVAQFLRDAGTIQKRFNEKFAVDGNARLANQVRRFTDPTPKLTTAETQVDDTLSSLAGRMGKGEERGALYTAFQPSLRSLLEEKGALS